MVFFVGTYDTPGVSHCGLYLGDGMMIHAGDPIGYANLNSSYWQAHLYAYGRLPDWRIDTLATSKSAKIQTEIEKVKAKITEQQARLKELEQKKMEAENTEIVDIVRGLSISLDDLPALLQTIQAGGGMGQSVPKAADPNDKEDTEE